MTNKKAWVTLATNDTYCLGALVLAQSLKKVNTTHDLVILITSSVTYAMRGTLQSVFNNVKEVNLLDSGDVENLKLLARPELGITFTKLHCWRLTQYEKCVFLDADTLVLQNCDELFDREELSAAPDVGWPDCFNSGVFVFKPSEETYRAIVDFALAHGSFDGGDQGLLNMFFSDWATSDSSKRLPFLYNLSSAAIYSYLPAFKWFGKGVKIIHFIGGNAKPWLQSFNSVTRTVSTDPSCSHIHNFMQYWWDLFCATVYPGLSPEMTRLLLRFWFTPHKPINYNSPRSNPSRIDSKYLFNDFVIPDEKIVLEMEEHFQFTDPWEELEETVENAGSYNVSNVSNVYNQYAAADETVSTSGCADNIHETHRINYDDDLGITHLDTNFTNHFDYCTDGIHCEAPAESICADYFGEPVSKPEPNSAEITPKHLIVQNEYATGFHFEHTENSEYFPSCHSVVHSSHLPAKSLNEGSLEDNDISHIKSETEDNAGLANTFSQMKLEEPSTEQQAREDFLRRQNWEHGNIDYMGRDSFDNILSKINQTISKQSEPDSVDAAKPVSADALSGAPSPTDSESTEVPTTEKSVAVVKEEKLVAAPASEVTEQPPASCPKPAVEIPPSAPTAPVQPPIEVPSSVLAEKSSAPPPETVQPPQQKPPSIPTAAEQPSVEQPPPALEAVPQSVEKQAPAVTKQPSAEKSTPPAPSSPAVPESCPLPPVTKDQTAAEAPVSCPKPVAPVAPIPPEAPVSCPKPVAPTPPEGQAAQTGVKSETQSESTSPSAAKSESSQKAAPSRQSSAQESQGKQAQKSGKKK